MAENIFPLTIHSLTYGGFGLSRLPDGKAVFVPFVMPGEKVLARIIEEKRSHAIAELFSIEKSHPSRIEPRCIHFARCGGCHFQHIPYPMQIEVKKIIFIEQLQRLAGMGSPFVEYAVSSDQQWNYRNALQFNLNEQADLCFADFYQNQPFPLRECLLPMPEIDRVWHLAEFESGLDIQRVEYRQNKKGECMMILNGSPNDMPELESETSLSIVHANQDDQIVIAGESFLDMQILNRNFKISAGTFFQTNFSTAEHLVKIIVEIVQKEKVKSIVDVYCGAGLFSAFLAESANRVAGIEVSHSACEDFIENLDDFDNVTLYQGKAEFVLPYLEESPDCFLVDPPRAGLKREVTESIIQNSPPLLIYISCNPATFARDARYLVGNGYELESSIIVDMFPQTFHIESVNVFRCLND